ncbi:MAG: phosphatase PAP2 family protein [Muribaculaceae bacterium]|nr:phosphatase PAP2 family protein [Muribaculaceae bacterium]MDE7141436.1 phosphatase PAP2 family protein [Muribaculaceae bacterium]
MIDFLSQLDTQIFLTFNGIHSDFFDSFMKLFTGRFIWIPMYVALAAVILHVCRWQKGVVYLLAIGAAIALTDQTCASLIRPAVERLRPSNPDNPLSELVYIVGGYRGGSYGFPSCHSANSFALATFICLLFPRRRMVLFILAWALLNSYTRLYLGVHYPGDLLVGAAVGSAFGALCYRAALAVAPMSKAERLARTHRPLVSIPYIGADRASVAQRGQGFTPPAMSLTVKVFTIPSSMTPFAVCAATLLYIIIRSL